MVSYVDVLTVLLIFFLAAAASKFKASPVVKMEPRVSPPMVVPQPPYPLAQVEHTLSGEKLNLK